MVPADPEVGLRLVILGVAKTVKATPLLATALAVTTTFPVVAPVGTGTAMVVALQFVGIAAVPLKVTVPVVEPKFDPVMITGVPTGPEIGLKLVMDGVGTTVNVTGLLTAVPTVTRTLPVLALVGTVTVMLLALQLVGVAGVPLKLTVLVPCVAPKLVPVIVTTDPAGPEAGLILVIVRLVPVPP